MMTNNSFEINSNYGNTSCGCCGKPFREKQLVYLEKGKFNCEKCAYGDLEYPAFVFAMNASEHVFMSGEPRLIITPEENTVDHMENGVYKVDLENKRAVVWEELDDFDEYELEESIEECLQSGFAVILKREDGTAVRFPKSYCMPKNRFNFWTSKYKKLRSLLTTAYYDNDLKYICRGSMVIGAVKTDEDEDKIYGYTLVYDDDEENAYYISESSIIDSQKNADLDVRISHSIRALKSGELRDYMDEHLSGQSEAVSLISYLVDDYLRGVSSGSLACAPRYIITGPSGSGKTEVARILKEYFKEKKIPVPLVRYDLSHYTEAGYKGKDFSEIVDNIAKEDRTTDGIAICFLDEADKKFVPSISSSGANINAAFQSNLLTMIEGNIYTVNSADSKNPDAARKIDTSKTMFVLLGAFQDIRDEKQKKKRNAPSLGFGAEVKKSEKADVDDCFYEDISIDDMIEVGMLEELAGRIEQVINLRKIPEKEMETLIKKKADEISKSVGISIKLTDEAVASFLEISYTSLGVRKVMNIIKELARGALADVYFKEDFDADDAYVVINSTTEAYVKIIDSGNDFCEPEV